MILIRNLATRYLTLLMAALTFVAVAKPADAARGRLDPYIEVQQVVDADFNDGGDVLTYTALAAGIDGSIENRRIQATASYRYERQIPWESGVGQNDIHNGLARARAQLTEALSIDGGAIATRARSDIRGGAPVFLTGDASNVTQVYGIYAGPNISTRLGALDVAASYHLGYVKVSDRTNLNLPAGQQALDSYDHATSHNATASVGMAPGELPFGWTVSGGYTREDASQLDQRFRAAYLRGDILLPVSPTLALTAGVGYEDIRISQRDPLLNPDGSIAFDGNGRFVTDRSSPRRIAYDTDGLIYDAGVIWKPNRRTTLQVRAGHRYGGTLVIGSLEYQIGRDSGVTVNVYDGIQSFGRSLTSTLGDLPTNFEISRNPLTGDFNRCVFGLNPGTGGCLDDTLQSISTTNYRNRGISALYSARRGPWSLGVGAGYAERRYLAPTGTFFTVDQVKDRSWMLQGQLARRLSERSGIDGQLYANWYNSGIANATDVKSYGITTSYYHYFTNRLSGRAAVGLSTYDQEGFDSRTSGQLSVALRYQF